MNVKISVHSFLLGMDEDVKYKTGPRAGIWGTPLLTVLHPEEPYVLLLSLQPSFRPEQTPRILGTH